MFKPTSISFTKATPGASLKECKAAKKRNAEISNNTIPAIYIELIGSLCVNAAYRCAKTNTIQLSLITLSSHLFTCNVFLNQKTKAQINELNSKISIAISNVLLISKFK